MWRHQDGGLAAAGTLTEHSIYSCKTAFFHLDGRLTAHLFGACALCHVLLHTVSVSFWGSCHQDGGSSQQLPFCGISFRSLGHHNYRCKARGRRDYSQFLKSNKKTDSNCLSKVAQSVSANVSEHPSFSQPTLSFCVIITGYNYHQQWFILRHTQLPHQCLWSQSLAVRKISRRRKKHDRKVKNACEVKKLS